MCVFIFILSFQWGLERWKRQTQIDAQGSGLCFDLSCSHYFTGFCWIQKLGCNTSPRSTGVYGNSTFGFSVQILFQSLGENVTELLDPRGMCVASLGSLDGQVVSSVEKRRQHRRPEQHEWQRARCLLVKPLGHDNDCWRVETESLLSDQVSVNHRKSWRSWRR